ncbi:MAG: ATP-binding protein [Aristaeellaceae bacterium]
MMTDQWFISEIDHRISTALIFFLLLILIGKKHRRSLYPLRLFISLTGMCLVSWFIRYVTDVYLVGLIWHGLGYSFHLLAMSLLYMAAYAFCYQARAAELIYVNLLALTIYKLAWNTFKVFATGVYVAGGPELWTQYSIMGSIVSYATYGAVCLITCKVHQKLVKKLPNQADILSMLISYGAFLFCQILLEFCGRVFTADTAALFLYYLCSQLYTIITYVVLLTISQLTYYRRDNEDMHNFIKNKMQYYQMSHDGITSLQIKCHDLKHQIAAIRTQAEKENFDKYLDQLEDSIIEYGTVVECGHETINVVLTEKNILCSTCGVKFSYIIDGTLFNFMSEMEIYSLFGNALDNALESCTKVTAPEKRFISLKAASRGDMVILHVENAFEEALNMVDGMPQTTKKGSGHGFGLRSIQSIAEKYDGVATVQTSGDLFKLTVLMKPSAARN